MEKVLIVDDEPAALRGLRACIDWEGLELEICAEARNGARAFELVEEHNPAVVVSDVRMPFVDGIELARSIQERAPDTKVILISAYADLDQIRSGFKLDAVDYVLKPIQVQELEAAVSRALQKRAREKKAKTILREKFLVELIAGVHSKSSSIRQRMRWLDIDLPLSCPYLACVVLPAEELDDPAAKEMLLMAAGELIQRIMRDYFDGVAFRSLSGEIVCLIPVNMERTVFFDRLDAFLGASPRAFERERLGDVWIGVGTEAGDIGEVNGSYDNARIALEQRFFEDGTQVYYCDFSETAKNDHIQIHPGDLESVRHAVAAGNEQFLRSIVEKLIADAVSSRARDVGLVHSLGFRLIIEAADTLVKLGEPGAAVAVDAYGAWRTAERQKSFVAFQEVLLQYLLGACQEIAERRKTHNQALVDQIRDYVEENYDQPIGISHIADTLEYTVSHICNVFKKQTGMTINAYLTQHRLRRAVELLRNHSLRLYEICSRVGYGDYKHFVSLFKRHYGVTPSRYRDRLVYEECVHDSRLGR